MFSKKKLTRKIAEKGIEALLLAAASIGVLTTFGIFGILFTESLPFFKAIGLKTFFLDPQWTPLFSDAHYGIRPLLCGTVMTTLIALLIAIPAGSTVAIYLSEYASRKLRETVKPILELLSAIPTVVFGYFALLFVTPTLQRVFPDLPGFNMLSGGLVMGIMILPMICSLTEDAMRAVPRTIKEGSYALGATKFQTSLRVVYPAAFSGISSAYILGISRAIGETMIVAIASGMQPNLTLDPTEPSATITAYIVQVSLGDLPHNSIGYQTIYAAGFSLFILTLFLNILGHGIKKRFNK